MKFIKKFFKSGEEQPEQGSTRDIMADIYANNKWGGRNRNFYSGRGSHKKKIINPYIKIITELVQGLGPELTILDLGCGDFNVGKEIVPHAGDYIAIDVVEELIERNKKEYKNENLRFNCLNIVEDDLPEADCVLIRQVMQHLSNKDISKVAMKLSRYPHVIVTEHLPKGEFTPNLDKPTGADIRLSIGSGVILTKPPFNLKPKKESKLMEVNYWGGTIVSTYYQFAAQPIS